MRRRGFLLACATATLVAGCMGDDETSEGTSPTATTADEPTVDDHLGEARTEFQAAWNTFEEEVDKFDTLDDRVSFRTDVIDQHLTRSAAALDRAEEEASAEEQAEIDAFRDVLDWSRSTVSTFESLGDAMDEYATATTYLDNERFEDGADRFSAASDHVDDAESDLSAARSSYENIDTTAFDDYDEIDALELELLMDDLEALLTDFGTFSRSLRHFSLGFHSFEAGGDAFDDERFRDAADRFGEARSEFATANSIATDGEAEASDDFVDDFIGLSCLTGAFRDSAGHFESAAEAAERDEWSRAESEIEEAEAAVDRCEYDI